MKKLSMKASPLKKTLRFDVTTRKLALASALAVAAVVSLLFCGEAGEALEAQLGKRLLFLARRQLNREPGIHPRLRIFELDHQALVEGGGESLGAADWAALLRTLALSRPSMIYVDKTFGYPLTRVPDEAGAMKLAAVGGPPIVAACFTSSVPLTNRTLLPLGRPEFDLHKRTVAGASSIPWMEPEPAFVYGPHSTVLPLFSRLGHGSFEPNGFVRPFLRVNEDVAIPHQSLHAAQNIRVWRSGLTVAGHDVPLDAKGRIPVNLLDEDEIRSHSVSLVGALRRAREGKPSKSIHPGDIVVLLMDMVQNQRRMVATPRGELPANYISVSMLNSVLTGAWLYPVGWLPLFVLGASLLGFLLGARARRVPFWIGLVVLAALIPAVAIGVFVQWGWLLPWLPTLCAALGSALVVFAEQARVRALQGEKIFRSLEGLVDAQKLKELVSHPARLKLEPSQRVLTVMFLDIARFSAAAQGRPPQQVFAALRDTLDRVSAIVHRYGGVVDKTLGDGLLSFFGYQYDGDTEGTHHAVIALECAAEIQRENVRRTINAEDGEPCHALRIGLNTAEVFVGDLGGRERIEFTLIGNGVNFAQRLETACEPNLILCGMLTRDYVLRGWATDPGFRERLIPVKHSEHAVAAYEYDPFTEKPQLLKAAQYVFRKRFALTRAEDRWPVPLDCGMQFEATGEDGQVVNYSRSGLAVACGRYYSRGVALEFTVKTPDGTLEAALRDKGIPTLRAEVVWGAEVEGRRLHGFRLMNLSEEQKDLWSQCLRDFIIRSAVRAA